MKSFKSITALASLIVLLTVSVTSAQENRAGVVRISDQAAAGEIMKAQAQSVGHLEEQSAKGCATEQGCDNCDKCNDCYSGKGCTSCLDYRCFLCEMGFPCLFHKSCGRAFGCKECDELDCYYDKNGVRHCRNGRNGRNGGNGRFGRNCRDPKCRRPVPYNTAPFGKYTMAYPLDVNYFDGRDGGLYAAQGYGINMSVPLAPCVGATYNYGWGVPSSRLSYIGNRRPLPQTYLPTQPQPAVIPVKTP